MAEMPCGLLQGRAHQLLVVQCQIVTPENIHTRIIIPTEKIRFRGHEFGREWERYVRGFEGGTEREKCYNIILSKIKKKIQQ